MDSGVIIWAMPMNELPRTFAESLLSLSCQELGLAELYAADRITQGLEVDHVDPADRDALDAIRREQDERARLGIFLQHDHERIEVALAPFGPEWEREQRERFEVSA